MLFIACPFRKLNPTILMTQTAENTAPSDGSALLEGPVGRGVFAKPKMGARFVIIMCVFIQDVSRMGGIPDEGVIKTFTPDQTDNPLDISVLPG